MNIWVNRQRNIDNKKYWKCMVYNNLFNVPHQEFEIFRRQNKINDIIEDLNHNSLSIENWD